MSNLEVANNYNNMSKKLNIKIEPPKHDGRTAWWHLRRSLRILTPETMNTNLLKHSVS